MKWSITLSDSSHFPLQTILHVTARLHSLIYPFTYLSNSWWLLTQKTILSSSQAVIAVRLACHVDSAGKENTRPNFLDSILLTVQQTSWALCLHWFSFPPNPEGEMGKQVQVSVAQAVSLCHTWGNLSLENPQSYIRALSNQAQPLSPSETLFLLFWSVNKSISWPEGRYYL